METLEVCAVFLHIVVVSWDTLYAPAAHHKRTRRLVQSLRCIISSSAGSMHGDQQLL